jgi:hypothetical protein
MARYSCRTLLQNIAEVDRSNMNDEYIGNMAILLQSFDHNGDAYDGIEIKAAMRDVFSQHGFDLATMSSEDLYALIKMTARRVVSEDEAMVHVKDMLLAYTDLEASDMNDRVADDINNSLDIDANGQLLDQSDGVTLFGTEDNDILFGGEVEEFYLSASISITLFIIFERMLVQQILLLTLIWLMVATYLIVPISSLTMTAKILPSSCMFILWVPILLLALMQMELTPMIMQILLTS